MADASPRGVLPQRATALLAELQARTARAQQLRHVPRDPLRALRDSGLIRGEAGARQRLARRGET